MAVTGHKIYIVGNIAYIDQIVDSGSAMQFEGLAKNCLPRKKYTNSTEFSFTGFNGLSETQLFPIAMLKDGNGDAWADQATFEAWATSNLGKSSAGDSALIYEGYLTQNGTDAPTVEVIDNSLGLSETTPMSYIGEGYWKFDKVGGFPDGKIGFISSPFVGNGAGGAFCLSGGYGASPDGLDVYCYKLSDMTTADSEANRVYFKITVKQS